MSDKFPGNMTIESTNQDAPSVQASMSRGGLFSNRYDLLNVSLLLVAPWFLHFLLKSMEIRFLSSGVYPLPSRWVNAQAHAENIIFQTSFALAALSTVTLIAGIFLSRTKASFTKWRTRVSVIYAVQGAWIAIGFFFIRVFYEGLVE